MPLTDQNVLTLAKPFKPAEHGYKNGNPYLRKSAIRARLSQVDLLWTLGAPEYVATEGDVVIYKGALTVGGVTRWGLGAGLIQRTENEKPVEGYSLAKNIAHAHKSAVTDILARAAQEFGVGNYLRDKPWDKTPFRDWIAKVNNQPAGQPPEPNAWANQESVQRLVNRCVSGLKLTMADIARLTGIAELEDYPSWNGRYADLTAAAEAIKAALEKEQAEPKPTTSRFTQPAAAPR